jgi:hypothetical protein
MPAYNFNMGQFLQWNNIAIQCIKPNVSFEEINQLESDPYYVQIPPKLLLNLA